VAESLAPSGDDDLLAVIRSTTPARLFLNGEAASYPTSAWLELRADHAAARDAVHSVFDPDAPRVRSFLERHNGLVVSTRVPDDHTYLLRPDLGRQLAGDDVQRLSSFFANSGPPDVLVALAGGLSATAAMTNGLELADLLLGDLGQRGWRLAPPVVVRRARVGVMNDLGDVSGAVVVILLIGERPGLAVSDSVSAYLAYRPTAGDSDARRNLISGITGRLESLDTAAQRVLSLAQQIRETGVSGWSIREASTTALSSGDAPIARTSS